MALALLDVGNSAAKWAPFGKLEQSKAYVHHACTIPPEFFDDLKEKQIDTVYGCCVAPAGLKAQAEKGAAALGIKCKWLASEEQFCGAFDVLNGYKFPQKLGADRWFALLGAADLFPDRSIVLVQLGTATTVDTLFHRGSKKYDFLGGRIAPGIGLMEKALFEQIPLLASKTEARFTFPSTTQEAISTGILEAQMGIIEFAVQELKKNKGCDNSLLVVTGGCAGNLIEEIKKQYPNAELAHNLVLRGLSLKAGCKEGVKR